MGILDTFKDIWKSNWSWKNVEEGFSSAKSNVVGAGRSFWGGLYNSVIAAHTMDPEAGKRAVNGYLDFSKQLLSAGVDAFTGVTSIPPVSKAFQTLDTAQNELVRRPLGTASLIAADQTKALLGGSEAPGLFDGDTWRQAYNDTRKVSVGQAMMYAGAQAPFGNPLDPSMDPRTDQGQNYYHTNAMAKWASGLEDTAVVMLADPTVGGMKVAKVGKLKYLSHVMDAAAIKRGAPQAYIEGRHGDRLFQFARNAPSADVVHRTVLNGATDGGIASKVIYESARIEDPTVARRVFDLSFQHMTGDPNAITEIAREAPRIAGAIGDMGDGAKFATVAKDYATGNAAGDAVVNARRATDTQAFLDDYRNGLNLYSRAGGILQYAPAPRVTLTSRWRDGIHQFANNSRATFFAAPAVTRAVRSTLPSSTFTRIINFEDPAPTAVENIRSNWEGARILPAEVLAKHVGNYAGATTSEGRFQAFMDGENAIFKEVAIKYGFSPEEAEKAINKINSIRATTRAAFSQSRRYMSNEARKLAQSLWDASRHDESSRLNELADHIDEAVKRGDQPESVSVMPDEDGNQLIIPLKFDVGGSPVMPTQHADLAAAMDWKLLHQALWWESRGPIGSTTQKIGHNAYVTLDRGRTVLDAASSVWKVATLLRPGYTWRMLSDESARALAVMGAGPVFTGAVKGMSNIVANTWTRAGRFRDEAYLDMRAARGVNRYDNVNDAEEVAGGVTHSELPEARPILETRPRTHEELATAVQKRHARNPDLLTPEARGIIETHIAAGTDPNADLAAHIATNGVPKGLVTQVKVTKVERKVIQQYTSLGKALADGVIEPEQFGKAAQSAFENRPRDVTADMASIIRQHKDMGTDPTHDLVEHALWMNDRDMYSRAVWQQGFLDDLAQKRTLLVDPFSGMAPTKIPKVTGFRTVARMNPENEAEGLYDFVRENLDELLKPDSILHAQVMKDGFIELAVAKHSGADVVKPTGGRRIKVGEHHFDYRQSGAGGLRVTLKDGTVIHVEHAFDGAEGPRLQAQVSSKGEGQSWADRMTDKQFQDFMQQTRGIWRDVNSSEQHYAPSWQRVVNIQLGNDAVARQILAGHTDDQIVAWLRKDPRGQAYLHSLGPWQGKYWAQVATVRKLTEMYVPGFANKTEATEKLRNAVLNRNASLADLKAVIPNVEDMPTVHGNAIEAAVAHGVISRLYSKTVNKVFAFLGDMPADRMARFPFTAERYKVHVQNLAEGYLANYHKAGYDSIPVHVIGRIQDQARNRAAADAKKYLYDAATSHDVARFTSLVVPFGSAIFDSFSKWGRIARERPWVPYDLWKAWTAPDRGGYTTDDQGNHKRFVNGSWRWVSQDPIANKETVLPEDYKPSAQYVSLQLASDLLPGFLAGEIDGVKFAPKVNKDSFNTFLSLPTAGPIVAVPANAFALNHPEFGEDKFVKRFVLPFGAQGSSASLFIPGYMKTLYGLFTSQDADLASQQAVTIWQTEMVNYSKGDRNKPPTIAEARDKASQMKGVRWLYQMAGLSPTFTSPYQPYIDYYRQLRAQYGTHEADSRFYEQAGSEFFALTASVTRNNSGILASIPGFKAYQKYKDMIDQYPDLAGLIVGAEGAGAFSSSAYQWQLQQPIEPGSGRTMRERMPLKDSIEDVAIREGWLKYNKLMSLVDGELLSRGLVSVSQKGAEDLKEAKDRFINSQMYWQSPNGGEAIHPWYVDFNTVDRSRVTARLNGMSQIINDPRLRQRDDIRGLTDYLSNRQQMVDMMAADNIKTLNSQKATPLRGMWDNYVMQLRDQNLGFADLYHRYLTNDQFLDAPL